jgi:hypothetical protein
MNEDCARFTNRAPQIDGANQFLSKVTFSGYNLIHFHLLLLCKLFLQPWGVGGVAISAMEETSSIIINLHF